MKRSAQIGLLMGGLGIAAAGGGYMTSRPQPCQPNPDGTQTCPPASSSSSGYRSHGIGSRPVYGGWSRPSPAGTSTPSAPARSGFGSIGRSISVAS
jgi:hypothetical protein